MWRQRLALLFVIGLSVTVPPFSAASAQAPPANLPANALPSDAELDALLVARNWNNLGTVLSRPGTSADLSRELNWLRTRLDNGGGFFLAILYARDLWTIGNASKVNDPARDVRLTAAMISLYAYELIVVDGCLCEDRSAPENRLSQLFTQRAATFSFLKQLPPDLKAKMVDMAVALEKKTAPLRRADDLVCRDGMDQMRASLEKGTQQEMPKAPGYVGKRIAVAPPADWTPKFVSLEVYRPMQDKARADMRGTLLGLVGLPSR